MRLVRIGNFRRSKLAPIQRFLQAAACALLMVFALATTGVRAENTYWPGATWRTSSPEAQGLDSTSLSKAFAYIRLHELPIHSLLIVRNGYVVLDAYFFPYAKGERHDVASVTKSVTATLIGLAIGKGNINSVEQPIATFFPGRMPGDRQDPRRKITLEQLLTMTSGLDCDASQAEASLRNMISSANWIQFALDLPMAYPPGTHFGYCSPGMHLLSGVLSRTTGASAFDFARRELFAQLGISNVAWKADAQGVSDGWGDLQLLPEDMARLGYFWLNQGRWGARRIVPAWYVRAATRTHVRVPADGSDYGYGFWVRSGGPDGRYEALGRGGQRITILPDKQMVVVITGGGFDPEKIAGFLFDSIKSDCAIPEDPAALSALRKAVAMAAEAPTDKPSAARIDPEAMAGFSGRRFFLRPNVWGLSSFRFDFPANAAPTVALHFADSHVELLTLGEEGAPATSIVGGHRVLAAASSLGRRTLVVDYDQSALINHFQLRFERVAAGVEVQLWEKTANVRTAFSGHEQP